MKKNIFFILCLTSLLSASQIKVLEYAEYIAHGAHASAKNLDEIFRVTKNDKSTLYRYSTARYSGQVEILCTGETFPFQIRTIDGKFEDVNSIWSPMPYFTAYFQISDRMFEPGIRMVTILKNNKEYICLEDKKTCVKKQN